MTLVVGMVLAAAFCHAAWHAAIKASGDRIADLVAIHFVSVSAGLVAIPFVPRPQGMGWALLGISVLVHLAYKALLPLAYGAGDLSVVFPLARGVAPIMAAIIAAVVLGEILGSFSTAGMVLICVGIAVMAVEGVRGRFRSVRPLLLAAITGMTIALYTVIDGMGARQAPTAMTFTAWLFVLDGCAFIVAARYWRGPALWTAVACRWRRGLGSGVLAVSSYGIFLWALSLGAVGVVAALRETSVLFAIVIGRVLLSERLGTLRWLAGGLMGFGIACIAAAR